MSDIHLEGGAGVLLHTGGKYCPGDITVTSEKLDTPLAEQGSLIEQIRAAMQDKTASGVPDLPPGYRRADYIQFTGEQVVDTGIICNQNTSIRTYFTRENSAQKYLYGVASPNNDRSVTAYLGGTFRFGTKSANKPAGTISTETGYGLFVDATQIGISGSVSTISDVADFETVGTLLIGTCRSAAGAVGAAQFVGKITHFIIWDGGEPVLKLVPVTDGTVFRFWDTVGKKFCDSITDVPLSGGNW